MAQNLKHFFYNFLRPHLVGRRETVLSAQNLAVYKINGCRGSSQRLESHFLTDTDYEMAIWWQLILPFYVLSKSKMTIGRSHV